MKVSSFSDAHAAISEVYVEALKAFGSVGMADAFREVVEAAVQPYKISQFLEICYALRDVLPQQVIDVSVSVGSFAAKNGFYGLANGDRGNLMVAVLKGESVLEVPDPSPTFARPLEPSVET